MSPDGTQRFPSPDAGPDPALCFGSVVDAYERGRPGYPMEAARWLTGDEPLSVLELGAGTGKLTRELVALGHDVHATDPDPAMLDILSRNYVVTRISQTTAEEIPVPDSTFDIVIAAQSYHWFDHEQALPEIARVLKRGGSLSLVWNTRDERIPWVKRLGRVIGSQEQGAGPGDELESSPYFGPIEHETFKHWQVIDRSSIQDLVLSRSNVATLSAEAARPSCARSSRSTTTSAAAWTACSCPTSPSATAPSSASSRSPRRRRRRRTTSARPPAGRALRRRRAPRGRRPADRRRLRGPPHRLPLSPTMALRSERWWHRGHLGSEADRAAFRALHQASLASPALREGLNGDSAERAIKHLRTLLGTPALALTDTATTLAWDGSGGHHEPQAGALAAMLLAPAGHDSPRGWTRTVEPEQLPCTAAGCPVRTG